jgi:hypothetical protein
LSRGGKERISIEVEPPREVKAARDRVKVLGNEISRTKKRLSQLEKKQAKEKAIVDAYDAEVSAEMERREFSHGAKREAGRTGKQVIYHRKDLEWLLKHMEVLKNKRDTKGKSESAWARRRIPTIKGRIKTAMEYVARADREEKAKAQAELTKAVDNEEGETLEEWRRRRRKEARQQVKVEKTRLREERDERVRHLEYYDRRIRGKWRNVYVTYWIRNSDLMGSWGPLPWRYLTLGTPEEALDEFW